MGRKNLYLHTGNIFKKILDILFLFFAILSAKGQDMIITTDSDTIFCKITRISSNLIYYEQTYNNRTTVGRFIPREHVWEYFVINSSSFRSGTNRKTTPFSRWLVGLQGGGAYLVASTAESEKNMQSLGLPQSQINDYHKQLRHGVYTGASVHYLITSFFGAGLRYSLFSSTIRMDYALRENNSQLPTFYCMGLKENLYVNYIGPSVMFHHWLGRSHQLSVNEEISIGYANFRDEERLDPYQYVFISEGQYFINTLIEGHTMGGGIKAALAYHPSSLLSITANAGLFTAPFFSLKMSTKEWSTTEKFDLKDFLNMSRVEYSLGINFHF